MTAISGTSLLSGLAVQQNYGTFELDVSKTNRKEIRNTFTPSGDTVQISTKAWELFNAQATGSTTEPQPTAGDIYQTTAGGNAPGEAAGIYEVRISVEDQISQLETEITSLEAEIAALEERAETDELTAAVLRGKQARLQTLQAILTGLQAQSNEMY